MDQFFKDKLDHYQSKVPQTAWQDLEARLIEEQGKSKPYLWIILIALVLLTLGYLFYSDFFAEKEKEPVELENNAIASIDAFPTSYPVNCLNEVKVQTKSSFDLMNGALHQNHSGIGENFSNLLDINRVRYTDSDLMEPNSGVTENLKSHGSLTSPPQTLPYKAMIDRKSELKLLWPGINNHCYSNPNHYFFAELNAGIDFPFQKLGIQHFASENQHYLTERAGTEFGSVSYNVNLLAGYMHPTGLLAKTGIQYAQLNEKFYFVKQNMIKIQTQITIDTMFNEDGSYKIHRDTTTIEVMGEEKLTTNNRFSMVDVPVIMGYRYAGSNFGLEFNAGLIFNILNYSSGRIFDESIEPTYYGADGNGYFSPFKTRVGLSLYAGVRYMTGFYGSTQFYIEPNLRYYFNSFSNSDYPLSQKYLVMGISSGMKYFF
ncbi:MAG TPA: hypothetical protein PLU49_10745 [Saprospiraceae bacterium]|nr:hypothetical protein [Saprospiraceae bacterium]